VTRSVQERLLALRPKDSPELDTSAARLLRRCLLARWREERQAETLAYRGWARSVTRRAQSAQVEAIRLRNHAARLRQERADVAAPRAVLSNPAEPISA
jgi:hypothetical protein